MKTDNNDLHLQFLREISNGVASLSHFQEALGAVAYYTRIFGVEAEYVGDFKLSAGKRNVLLYQRESGMPAGEPLSFTFNMDPRRSIVIYIFPFVLLEAQSCGLPVVAFDVRVGPGFVVQDGVNGYLAADMVYEDFCEKLASLMKDEDLRREFSAAAISHAADFSREKVGDMWYSLIGE